MVYAATHLTLALLEQLVHLNPDRLPAALRAFAIELSNGVPVEDDVPPMDDPDANRRYGDAWAASLRSAALIVPSVLIPAKLNPGDLDTEERNVLLNPRHRSAATWRVTETVFAVDRRLKRLA